jgi:hypothetical protein
MIKYFFLFVIGYFYYQLANKYNKTEWPYVLLGIVAYFFGIYVLGFILVNVLFVFGINVKDFDWFILFFITLLLGFIPTYIVYSTLEVKFKQKKDNLNDKLNNIGYKRNF